MAERTAVDGAAAGEVAREHAALDGVALDDVALDEAAPDDVALDEVVRFTSELIRIDTTNRGGGDCAERPAAEYVAERLAEAGIEPRLIESAPGRANVVARIPGSDPDADALLVHGHLDVVPAEPASTPATDAPAAGRAPDDTQAQRIRALRQIIQKRRAAQAAAVHEGEH